MTDVTCLGLATLSLLRVSRHINALWKLEAVYICLRLYVGID